MKAQPQSRKFIDPLCSALAWAGTLGVVIFSILGILCSRDESALMELDRQNRETSLAPDNLRRAAESFQISLAVEDRSVDAAKMTSSRAWQTLEDKLDSYASRLEHQNAMVRLAHDQSSRLRWIITLSSLVSAMAMLAGTLLKAKFHFNETKGESRRLEGFSLSENK